MFNGCQSLEFLDLLSFDTSLVTDMKYMFYKCYSLHYVDLKSFDTSLVTDMSYMFDSCLSLKVLDLNNFYTPSVKDISNIFSGCSSLEYLNIPNFDTSKVTTFLSSFYNCHSLKYLNISHFVSSEVTSFNDMFTNCTSLLFLDLSSFDTSKVKDLTNAFKDCKSLLYLNIRNFDFTSISSFSTFITGVNEELTYCLNEQNIRDDINNALSKYKNNCSNTCFNNNNKLNPNTKQCVENCSENEEYQYELNKICYQQCPPKFTLPDNNFICKEFLYCGNYYHNLDTNRCINYIPEGYYVNDTYLNTLDKCDLKCNECDLESMNLNLCISCNMDDNFFPKENDISNIDSFINCYRGEIDGYILDPDEKLYIIIKAEFQNEMNYEEYYENEKEIEFKEKNKEKDEEKMIIENEEEEYYKNENEHEELDYEKNIEEIKENELIIEYNEIMEINQSSFNEDFENEIFEKDYEENERVSNYDIISYHSSEIIIDRVVSLYHDKLKSNFTKLFENINITKESIHLNQKIIEELLNDGLLTEIIGNIKETNSSFNININQDIIQISFMKEQNKTKNTSYINFKELENIIKQENNIPLDDDLILLKIEHYIDNLKIPIIEYIIFSSDGKRQLNLSSYNNNKIELTIPVIINESEEYKYNPKSTYYNDMCHKYQINNDYDLTLYDRQGEYNTNNMALCEANCTYQGYDNISKNVKCECEMKNNFNFFFDIDIDTNKLIDKFINVKNIINFEVVKCYNSLFSKDGLQNNIGSYFTLTIIFLSIIASILFCLNGFNSLYSQIKTISQVIPNNQSRNNTNKRFNTHNNFPPKKPKKKYNSNKRLINNSSKKTMELNKEIKDLISCSGINNDNKSEEINQSKEKLNHINKKYEYNDHELNNLSYKNALIIDTRTFLQYYLSLIRTKQLIVFTFYTKTDYNSRIIKIDLFLFFLLLYFTINAFFFNDTTMHQIYEDKGNFNIIYQIPQMLYSTLISTLIKFIIEKLSLTEKDIIEIKQEKNSDKSIKIMNKTLKIIKLKFIIFFVLNFLFLFLFWFYLSSFCAVYKYTQIHLFKDTIISFCGSLIYPFVVYIFPAILRIKALKNKKKKRECLFKVSKALQLL